jgi:hypothetical protein
MEAEGCSEPMVPVYKTAQRQLPEHWKEARLTMPLPLVADDETSAITAIDRLTLPLLIPPTILANTKRAKLFDNAHRT